MEPELHTKIAMLNGDQMLTNFIVNDKGFEELWYTCSMISLISREWLRKQFKGMKVNLLESFLAINPIQDRLFWGCSRIGSRGGFLASPLP